MREYEKMSMGRKAETIYTAMKKNHLNSGKKNNIFTIRQSEDSFEEHMKKNAASKVCYVYINGISMPVLSA